MQAGWRAPHKPIGKIRIFFWFQEFCSPSFAYPSLDYSVLHELTILGVTALSFVAPHTVLIFSTELSKVCL